MIDELYGAARKRKDKGKSYKLIYKFGKFLAVTLYPIKAGFTKKAGIDKNSQFIISLTTFPDRIGTVWITISTLLDQIEKAKRVILYLAKEQFPDEEKGLPKKLLKLKDRGLEIVFCDDLKPHKKYYYAIKDNPESIVITADDDMLYPESMTKDLMDAYRKHTEEDANSKIVLCQYAHKIEFKNDGSLEEYQKWTSCYGDSIKPDMLLLPVGCGGVLYPPYSLDERIFDKEKIMSLCPMTDDLWLKTMEALNGTKAAICKTGSLIYYDMVGTRKSGLQHVNCGENQNDESIKRILEEYPELIDKLKL